MRLNSHAAPRQVSSRGNGQRLRAKHQPQRAGKFLAPSQLPSAAAGLRHSRAPSRLELQHGLDAADANGRMPGVLADVHFPMPAALTFLAVGFGNIPKGFSHSAQGCDAGTTLGLRRRMFSTPTGLYHRVWKLIQPRWGSFNFWRLT